MKLQVIGLESNRFGYVSITCLLPDPKEKIDTLKESMAGLDKELTAMIAPMYAPIQAMMDADNHDRGKMLRLPIEWEDFAKLDLKLGDYINLDISRVKK